MNAYLVGSLDRQVEELAPWLRRAHDAHHRRDLAALASPRRQQPDVVVLDLRSGAQRCLRLSRLLRRQHPMTGVVIVASHLDPALMLEAMRAGVTSSSPNR